MSEPIELMFETLHEFVCSEDGERVALIGRDERGTFNGVNMPFAVADDAISMLLQACDEAAERRGPRQSLLSSANPPRARDATRLEIGLTADGRVLLGFHVGRSGRMNFVLSIPKARESCAALQNLLSTVRDAN